MLFLLQVTIPAMNDLAAGIHPEAFLPSQPVRHGAGWTIFCSGAPLIGLNKITQPIWQ
jgi:hypothetical protein